jgi:hypothetical protein
LRFVGLVDGSHAPEHALEVELPFLQLRLWAFAAVPLLVGEAAPEEVAGAASRPAVSAPSGAPSPSTPPPAATPPGAAPPPPAAPIKGFSLFFSVLWERIRRIFSRG